MNTSVSEEDFLRFVRDDLINAFNEPKCHPQEEARLTEAALVAIRKLAFEIRGCDEGSELGRWWLAFSELTRACKTRSEFLIRFSALTESLDEVKAPDLAVRCLREASKSALMAADSEVGCKWRLGALRSAGTAIGYLSVLLHPGELEKKLTSDRAKRAAISRHKDDRADRAHVWKWLAEHRNQYQTDTERVDAIVCSKQVSKARTTIQRWVTEWNREKRGKRNGS